jgi:hypothetical protein
MSSNGKLTEEEKAEYLAVFAEHIRYLRKAQAAGLACDAMRVELMTKHGLPPGHAFDVFGDGEPKPIEECAKPPSAH